MRKTIPVCGQYGVIKDQPAQELPLNAWTDARNVAFRGGSFKRTAGQVQVFGTPTVTPYFVTSHQTATKRYWVHAGLEKVFVDDGTTRTEITPASLFTGAIDDRWTGGTLNGVLGLNNGKDKPVYWDNNTANDLAVLPGWDANELCAVLVPFKNFWVALDITKSGTRYPYMMKWSSAADPGSNPASWDETDTELEAGEQDLGETGDLLVDARPLGDALILYKQNSRIAVRQTFDARVFSFQRLPGAGGALSRGCIVETPLGHMVFGNGDLYVHNGGEPQSLCNDIIRDFIFTSLDSTYSQRAFVVANTPKNEVWFCYPETGESACTLAAIYNYVGKTWTFRDLPNVTDADSGLFPATASPVIDALTAAIDTYSDPFERDDRSPANQQMLMATTAPRLDLVDSGGTFAGTAFTSYVERTGMVLDGDPSTIKLLTKIVPRFTGPAGAVVLIEAGGSMSSEEDPDWTFSYSYTVGTDREAYGFATGKFLSVRFSSTDARQSGCKSYDMEYELMGRY